MVLEPLERDSFDDLGPWQLAIKGEVNVAYRRGLKRAVVDDNNVSWVVLYNFFSYFLPANSSHEKLTSALMRPLQPRIEALTDACARSIAAEVQGWVSSVTMAPPEWMQKELTDLIEV
ncbi:MAG: hypothetical protein QGF25_01440 [Candidatus Woesearchaeota archaeon]|jgi:hypothetical protein|nr:hypothetical protein [Candidatus Woesearchaeota archaeon]MDP7466896.1 hypothetical protein [Candidatus Woesearchaeota archaeon]MDP7647331.1 hypothetical protein [Candidatus Woesearchaeota archaeon]